MLVPYLLKKIYPKQQHENIDNYIKLFQEFHSVVVYICCACGLYHYWINGDYKAMSWYGTSIFIQCFIDIFFCRFELMVHHIFVFIQFYLYWKYEKEDMHPSFPTFFAVLISGEISTVFITLKNVVDAIDDSFFNKSFPIQTPTKESLIDKLNIMLGITFLYTRVYLFGRYIIYDHGIWSYYNNELYFLPFFLLYLLNIYWACIIIKKGLKSVVPHLSCVSIEHFLSYSQIPSFLLSLYFYYPFQTYQMYDLFTQVILCCSSYMYHNKMKNALIENAPNTNINSISSDILPIYFFDIFGILFRNSGNYYMVFNYSNRPLQTSVLFSDNATPIILNILHIIGFISSVIYLTYLHKTKVFFGYHEIQGPKYMIINALISLPIVCTVFVSLVNMYHFRSLFIGQFLCLYTIILIRLMKVGYSINHILFHTAYTGLSLSGVFANKYLMDTT